MLSSRFFIKILLCILPQLLFSAPTANRKAPHRLKGWCDALRKLLGSAAGCHITGPVALRRSLSAGLPILLFLCGILHKNHKTFFFFFVNNPKPSLASCTKEEVSVWYFRIAASPRGKRSAWEMAACFLVFSLKYAKFYDIVVVVFTFHSPTLPAERKHP